MAIKHEYFILTFKFNSKVLLKNMTAMKNFSLKIFILISDHLLGMSRDKSMAIICF